jgi:hypothetical protein
MRLRTLPGWVVDNETSIREEAAPYIHMSMAERWEATRRCCEAASTMLRFNRDPAAVLAHRDPLPPSTVLALRRLRQVGMPA